LPVAGSPQSRRHRDAGATPQESRDDAKPRIVFVERNAAIAPIWVKARVPSSRCHQQLGVETRLGAGVASLDASGVTLSNGEHIETKPDLGRR